MPPKKTTPKKAAAKKGCAKCAATLEYVQKARNAESPGEIRAALQRVLQFINT